jgi:hypothetical protein
MPSRQRKPTTLKLRVCKLANSPNLVEGKFSEVRVF